MDMIRKHNGEPKYVFFLFLVFTDRDKEVRFDESTNTCFAKAGVAL